MNFLKYFLLILLFVSCTKADVKNQSKINLFLSSESIEDIPIFSVNTYKLPIDQKTQLLNDHLIKLGASPEQIALAIHILKNNCTNIAKGDDCRVLIQSGILSLVTYRDFFKDINDTPATKPNHPKIPEKLRQSSAKYFDTSNNFTLTENRATLYKELLDRSNANLLRASIPEMAPAFEKTEEQFLLLKQALSSSDRFKDFLRTFGKKFTINNTDPTATEYTADLNTHLDAVFQAFKKNVDFIDTHYQTILSKVKKSGWEGLEYLDLMKFHIGFYSVLDFTSIEKAIQKWNAFSINNSSFVADISLITKDGQPSSTSSRKYESLINSVSKLASNGQIGIITGQPLPITGNPFIINTAVPVFNVVTPNSFITKTGQSYSVDSISDDLKIAYLTSASPSFGSGQIPSIFQSTTDRKDLISRAKTELDRNVANTKLINNFTNNLPPKYQPIFLALIYERLLDNNHEFKNVIFEPSALETLLISIMRSLPEEFSQKYHLNLEDTKAFRQCIETQYDASKGAFFKGKTIRQIQNFLKKNLR